MPTVAPSEPAAPTSSLNGRAWLLALVLAAGTAALFAPALDAGWLWCDDYTIRDDPRATESAGFLSYWKPGTTDQYAPLSFTLLWVTAQVAGLDAMPLHALGLGLHAASVALLFLLLRRLGARLAWLGALLCAVHPLHVESVAWIYETKNPFSMVLLLVTAHVHLSALRRQSFGWSAGAVVLFAAAALAKVAVVVYPALVLCLVPWLRGVSWRRATASVLPMAAVAAGCAALTLGVEHGATGVTGEESPQGVLVRLQLMGRTLAFYLAHLGAPWPLAFGYPRFALDGSLRSWLPTGTFVVLGIAALWLAWRRPAWRAGVAVGMATAVAFLPVLGLVDIYMFRYTYVADHLTYLPLFVAIPAGLAWVAQRLPRIAVVAPALVLVLVWSLLTRLHLRAYDGEERLWRSTVQQHEEVWWGWVRLGLLSAQAGDEASAIRAYERALAIHDAPDAMVNVANAYVRQGRAEEALELFATLEQRGLGTDPATRASHASACAAAGRLDEAVGRYQTLVETHPSLTGEFAPAIAGLSEQIDRLDRELARMNRIRRERPDDVPAHRRTAVVALSRGAWELAGHALADWFRLAPDDPEAAETLAYWLLHHPDRSQRDGARALELLRSHPAPSDGDPERALLFARAHAEAGEWNDAASRIELARTLALNAGLTALVLRAEQFARRVEDRRPPP